MSEKIDAFIAKIRAAPEFIAGATADPTKSDELDAVERGIEAVYRDAEMIETFDKIQAVVDRSDLSMKMRLIEIGRLFTQLRDAGRSVN
jgi:hypothetical protein